ncbi:MAG: ATP-binding protein, partial [Saprospiraceae bacterium]
SYALNGRAKVAELKGNFNKAMELATNALSIAKKGQIRLAEADASSILSRLYERQKEYKIALDYFKLSHDIKDSISTGDYQNKLAYFESKTEIEKGQAEIELLTAQKSLQENIARQAKRFRNFIIIISISSLLVAFYIIRNINSKRRKIQSQNVLIADQKKQVESSLEELKATQSQMIQREKMASLGELTAGIAHEIQNPLNFVNNFSEVNTELINELKTELATGNTQLAIEIADNIKENEKKINHHGKRADGIVKGMLQHSQKSISEKVLVDINLLAEEYLRLSYHSFQSKYQNLPNGAKAQAGFACELILDLDLKLPLVKVIPQDIGRVLMNLDNNAFWAINEKNVEVSKRKSGEVYEPQVTVSTKKIGDKVEIKVTDNGNGIPDNIKNKIFQPFFTTKPSGQGTGLGLSLSYDIIKSHNGILEVNSKEGEYSEFIIQFPLVEDFARRV